MSVLSFLGHFGYSEFDDALYNFIHSRPKVKFSEIFEYFSME